MRAPFQVLVLPFRKDAKEGFQFAVFRRGDTGDWQGISGGGEEGETPVQAARREAWEEGGISSSCIFFRLDALSSVPARHFSARAHWPRGTYVIREHCFAVDCAEASLSLSGEHLEVRWVGCEEAQRLLRWDSNRTALWELSERLNAGDLERL